MSDNLSGEGRARDRRAWWEANPNYKAEYNAKHRDRILPQKREAERLRRARIKADAEHRAREVQRVSAWAKANPDKRKQARERYKAANPEAHRAAQREYYHRNKEKIRQQRQQREQGDGAGLMRAGANGYSTVAQAGVTTSSTSAERRERNLAHSREKRRVERRLKSANLPPRRIRRALASERRATESAADHFFNRNRTHEEVVRIVEGDYSRQRLSDDHADPRLLQEWSEMAQKIRQRGAFRREVRAYIQKHDRRLRSDVALDSRVRVLRGEGPLHEATEIHRRARMAVSLARPALSRGHSVVELATEQSKQASPPSTEAEQAVAIAKRSAAAAPGKAPGAPATAVRHAGHEPQLQHGL